MRIREISGGDVLPADVEAIWRINEAETPAVGSVTPEQLTALIHQSLIAFVVEGDGAPDATASAPTNEADDQRDPIETGDTEIGGFCLVLGPDEGYSSPNYVWFRDRFDDFIYLDRIALAPNYQRRGFGTELYAEVVRLAGQRRPTASQFALEVNLVPRNDPSLEFHSRLGFEQVGVRTPSPDYSVAMMVRPLGSDVEESSTERT